jgi:hypothetical protein
MSKFSEQLHPTTSEGGVDWGTVLRQNFDRFKTAIAESPMVLAPIPTWPGSGPRRWTCGNNRRFLGSRRSEGWGHRRLARLSAGPKPIPRPAAAAAAAALDLMEQQLGDRAAAGKTIDSLRESV